MEPILPPHKGLNLPLVGTAADDTDPPLLRLVKRLYTQPAEAEARTDQPLSKHFELFSMAHENAILREPWLNASGASVRACLMGDSCMGKHPLLPGHAQSGGGVVLAELMTPSELAEFETDGSVPKERRTCLLCVRYNIHTAYLHARKQRTFPANCLLNNFTNPAGEGEYNVEYLIPAPDNTAWAGICGTVVGLHLNALQLVQDPDRLWRVDQSVMAHIMRTNCNLTFPPLYRSLVPDPQAYLREFYTHRTRVSDAAILFFSFSEIEEVRPKFGQPSTDRFMKWPDGATKSLMHRLLHYRINRLNLMLEECLTLYGQEWAYNLQLYIDAHIGMALLFERGEKITSWNLKYTAHEHILPDFIPLAVQAAVNSIVPDNTVASERRREMLKPRPLVVQMLVRALPEFAQTRSLNAAFLKCMQNSTLSIAMFALAQAALLGNYTHVTARMPYITRKAMIRDFNEQTAEGFFRALPSNEHMILYIMHTYILSVLPLCPALESLVVTLSPIKKQAARVFEAMRVVRQTAASDWRMVFDDSVLETLRNSHKRLPKRKLVARGLADCSDLLLINSRRTAVRRGLKRACGVAFDPEFFEEQVKRARLDLPPPPDLVAACSLAASAILDAASSAPDKKPIFAFSPEAIDDASLKHLADFALATDQVRQARTTPLPETLVRAQVDAVARRFGCAPDDWDVIRRVSDVLICTTCGVRNFYLTHAERGATTRRVNNVRAAGYRKLAFNPRLNELRCVQTLTCSLYPLTRVSVAEPTAHGVKGGALVLRKCTLIISPCCGYLCQSSALRVAPSGMNCPCCADAKQQTAEGVPDPRICAHCSKRSQLKMALQQTVMLRDEEGRVKVYGFCRTHLRAWARVKSGYLTLEFVSRNMLNRNGAGLVLDPN
jgi:hypothetical protein